MKIHRVAGKAGPIEHRSGKMVQSVLIIGGGYNGYSVARSLHGSDLQIHIIHANRLEPARFSRFIDTATWHPSITTFSNVSRKLILGLVKELPGTTLILTSIDAWMQELAEQGRLYEDAGALLPFSNSDAVRRCLRKDKFAEWCHDNEIRIPLTLCHRQDDSIQSLLQKVLKMTFPLVVKPVTKSLITATRGHQIVTTLDEFETWIRQYTGSTFQRSLVIQEYIQGPVENIVSLQGYIHRNGEVAASQYRKLRQTHGPLGCCTAAIIEYCDPAVLSLAREILVDKLDLQGFFDIEFKQGDNGETPYLVEINPRLGMLNFAATLMGVNLPLIAISDFAGRESTQADERPVKGDWIWASLVIDLSCVVREAITVGDKVTIRLNEILLIPASFWSIYRKRKIVDPLWSRHDLASAAALVVVIVLGALVTLRNLIFPSLNFSTQGASTEIESNFTDSR